MEDKKVTVDGIELFPVWQVGSQEAWMKRSGISMRALENPNAPKNANWTGRYTFKTKESAVDALNTLIRDRNRGARVETYVCGGIGIDTVVDEDSANDMRIVDWRIRKQYKTQWEVEEQMEVVDE